MKEYLLFGPPILLEIIPPKIKPNKGDKTIAIEYEKNIWECSVINKVFCK